MIQYVVTVFVPKNIEQEWVEYMTGHHVADVVATGCFTHAETLRCLDPEREDVTVYMNRYFANTIDDLVKYRTHFGPTLQADHTARFGAEIQAERTIAEVIYTVSNDR